MDIRIISSLLLLQLLACACCESCPPREDILPCSCRPAFLVEGRIAIFCPRGSLKDIENVFDHLRGKTINDVTIWDLKAERLPSKLFSNTSVTLISLMNCDLQALSDEDGRAFEGLENTLEYLELWRSIKGCNQLKTLDLAHLTRLVSLTLVGNSVPEVGDDWFPRGPFSLTSVMIAESGLSKLGEQAFAPLANLKVLSLTTNRIAEIERSMMPNPASQFTTLEFMDNNLTSLPNDIFSGMPSLKHVGFTGNSISRIEEATWSSVWSKLFMLALEKNPLACDSHMEWMFSLKQPFMNRGTCASPDTVKGMELSQFIKNHRKFL